VKVNRTFTYEIAGCKRNGPGVGAGAAVGFRGLRKTNVRKAKLGDSGYSVLIAIRATYPRLET
jgi:hypothetical protein